MSIRCGLIRAYMCLKNRQSDRTEYTQAEFDGIGAKIRETLEPLVISLRDQGKAMRIGVNHGSLAERMLFTYGDTPEGMVESALEFIRICESLDFYNLVISLKASRVPVMLAAYRLMVKRMDELGMGYPLHLGVTEAGDGEYGRIKSTAGIGTLLGHGHWRHHSRLPHRSPRERNSGVLQHLAGPRASQNHGGIRRLPLLRSHPI